ncbi:MAG: alpha/beta hydrolase, partial [SAR324 cluster bacterium]|nr:alpha/beta hydrolase [SAR324 cluster bacterium]
GAVGFMSVFPVLANHFHVYAVDKLGMGLTDNPKEDSGYSMQATTQHIYRFMQTLGLENVHLVGHSYGAAICLRAALTHRARLHSLTLVEPTAYLLLEQGGDREAYAEVCAWRDQFVELAGQGALDEAWVSVVDRYGYKGAWQAMTEQARQRLRETTEMMIGGFQANSNNPTRLEECRRLGLPTLLIRGEKTVLPEAPVSEILARKIPGSRLEVIRAAGHISPLTHPNEVGVAIKPLLLNSREGRRN